MQEDGANAGIDLHLDLAASSASGLGRRAALEHALREAIRAGRLASGARLPATRVLAAELGLGRNTVSSAYDQLTAEGYLAGRRGAGTFVVGAPEPSGAAPVARTVREYRYDLRAGRPDVTTFPASAWLRAMRRALAAAPRTGYGLGDPAGRIEARTALARYLGRARGLRTDPAGIVLAGGYVQALGLLVAMLGPGATVAMEDPGLPLHREVVRRHGGRVVPIPVDELGARVGDVPGRPDAVVLTPAHQYPTGVTLHPSRRQEVLRWARRTGALVIEDDYDGEFRFDHQPVGALQGMAPDDVAYIGTASKTLAPALRLAWIALPRRLVGPAVETQRYVFGHTEALGQLALAELISAHDYDRHVRAGRLRYRRRRDQLLERTGPLVARGRLEVAGIAAGLQALLRLEPGRSEQAVLDAADARDLAVDVLGRHWHAPGEHPPGIIVGYGTPGGHAYPAALDVLVRVLRES